MPLNEPSIVNKIHVCVVITSYYNAKAATVHIPGFISSSDFDGISTNRKLLSGLVTWSHQDHCIWIHLNWIVSHSNAPYNFCCWLSFVSTCFYDWSRTTQDRSFNIYTTILHKYMFWKISELRIHAIERFFFFSTRLCLSKSSSLVFFAHLYFGSHAYLNVQYRQLKVPRCYQLDVDIIIMDGPVRFCIFCSDFSLFSYC